MNSIANKIGNNADIAVVAYLVPGTAGISKAETRVFEACASGMKRRRVADLLCRSISTINTQMEATLSKLGVNSIEEAVALTCAEGRLTFEAIARGSRNLMIIGFMLSSGAQLFADDAMSVNRVRLARGSAVRVVRARESVG